MRKSQTHKTSKGEEIARQIIETIFGAPFPSTYPPWLPTPAGARLQLDGYNATLNIAFEYQGTQHYQPFAPYTPNYVAAQQLRDEHKARICHQRGVTLITIPTFERHWTHEDRRLAIEVAIIHAGLGQHLKPREETP